MKKGILNIHSDKVFDRDPLRLIRLMRFYAKFNFKIPLNVLRLAKKEAHKITTVSKERVVEELKKIAITGNFHKAIKLMSITGLLYHILIEVQFLKTVKHDKRHSEGDPFVHTLMVMKHSKPTVVAQFAALFHDVGKPSVQKIEGEKISFIDHEDIGSDITRKVMERLKFDNDTTNKVVKLVKLHMRPHFLVKASLKAYRRFIRDCDTLLYDVLDLAEADSLGRLPVRNFIPDIRVKIEDVLKMPIKIRRVAILDGNEIMAALKIGPGKRIGEVQKFLIDLEDDYAENSKVLTKEIAVKKVRQLNNKEEIV